MTKYLHINSLILKYNADVFLGINIHNTLQNGNKNNSDKTNHDTL